MAVKIRFECGRDDRISHVYGPFEFVQLTYNYLRVGPDGDELAYYMDEEWRFTPAAPEHGIVAKDAAGLWSDVIIYTAD